METLSYAGEALLIILDPYRFMMLTVGVLIGIGIGIVPGLGGIVGLAILIPFTYGLDPYAAFALLIGMGAVTATSDVIPAVLFGVPGTVASAATVLDGYPLARQGQAARALGACYFASLLGGLFGAVLLGVAIPLLRPVMLYLGSPELLSFCVFGLSMVAVLSGRAPLRGLAAAGLGLMLAMIGASPHTGTLRWTFGALYLWDGLPVVPITLGLFALPELAQLLIAKSRIAQTGVPTGYSLRGQRQGMIDVLHHWWLCLRCSWLGAALGAVPGIGSSVIDWIAYGHALRTEKNTDNFGKGDIRGVIASESSNNAKEGGSLVPIIAFGVPAGASGVLLLSAFLMHGLQPGPEMLSRHLDVTYSIIWSVAIANILGALICIFASGQLARIAYIRFSILLPLVLSITFLAAFQGSQSWGDIVTLLAFGVLGWAMKRLGWPRPPLVLGFVLGEIFERYLFISVERYGWDWLFRPIVLAMFALALLGLYGPLSRTLAETLRRLREIRVARPNLGFAIWFNIGFLATVIAALLLARSWPAKAQIVPATAGWIALAFAGCNLLVEMFGPPSPRRLSAQQAAAAPVLERVSAEIDPTAEPEVPATVAFRRALRYFLWLVGFALACAITGILPAIALFILAFMRREGAESWGLSLKVAGGMLVFCWLLFDRLVATSWPRSLLGDWLPSLRTATGVL